MVFISRRVGGKENFFHCDTCGYCLCLTVKDSHFCRRQASHDNCPVCMEVSYIHQRGGGGERGRGREGE